MRFSRKVFFLVAATSLLGGCVSMSTMMVNQQGKWTRCQASGGGWFGAPVAAHNHSRCVDDLQKLGYAPLSDGVWGAKLADWSTSPAKIIEVASGSPAEKSGIKVGDIVKMVDGQPVNKGFDAMSLMANKKPGDVVKVQIERDGVLSEITSVLAKR